MTQELVICKGCRRRVVDEGVPCPHCGSIDFEHEQVMQTTMRDAVRVCRDCGKPMLDHELDCPYCGAGKPSSKVESVLLGLLCVLVIAAVLLLIFQ